MNFIIRGIKETKKGKRKYSYLQKDEEKYQYNHYFGTIDNAIVFKSLLGARQHMEIIKQGYLVGYRFMKEIDIYSIDDNDLEELRNGNISVNEKG